MALYDSIGQTFDSSRSADPAVVSRIAQLLNLQESDGIQCLDIGCGTGNYTTAISGHGIAMAGLDISKCMLNQALAKDASTSWLLGDASNLPFMDDSFEGAVCISAVHHFPHLNVVFQEIRRVVSIGRFVIFTSTPEQMKNYWLNEYI